MHAGLCADGVWPSLCMHAGNIPRGSTADDSCSLCLSSPSDGQHSDTAAAGIKLWGAACLLSLRTALFLFHLPGDWPQYAKNKGIIPLFLQSSTLSAPYGFLSYYVQDSCSLCWQGDVNMYSQSSHTCSLCEWVSCRIAVRHLHLRQTIMRASCNHWLPVPSSLSWIACSVVATMLLCALIVLLSWIRIPDAYSSDKEVHGAANAIMAQSIQLTCWFSWRLEPCCMLK